jgi:hypothetical protein
VIKLRGVPANVRFGSSRARGRYSASCTLIAGGDVVTDSGGPLLSRPSRQETDFFGTSKISLPANTCVISPGEIVQSVEIDIIRWGIGDSDSSTFFTIRQFRKKLNPNCIGLTPSYIAHETANTSLWRAWG